MSTVWYTRIGEKDVSNNLFGAIRTRLLLDQPFFGSLAMHLKPVENKDIDTLRTDGVEIQYNPDFLATLPKDQQLTAVAHEVMHCALLHIFRRGNRDMLKFNIAADFAINPVLVEAGFKPIPGWLYDPQFKGMSAEQIYAKLNFKSLSGQSTSGTGGQTSPRPGKGQGQGQTPGCPTGDFVDGKAEAGSDGSEQDWKVVAEQAAAVAQAAGNLPGSLSQEIKKTHTPKVDWKQELRDFLEQTMPSDYSWTSPNRRFVSQGVYLPGVIKENMGVLGVAVDMSGSTWGIQHVFAGELQELIREARPEKTIVIYWDTRVIDVVEYGPQDNIRLEAKGGGGTIFQPVLDWVEEQQIDMKAMICLTDLEIGGKMTEPTYPVLFAVPEFCSQKAPFGRVIPVTVDK